MAMIFRRFLPIFLVWMFIFPVKNSIGQSSVDYQWYLNANAGFTQMYGDLSNSSDPIGKLSDETDLGYGFRLGKFISPVFSAHFQFLNARFKGLKESSDLQFASEVLEMQLGTTVNFLNLFGENRNRTVSLYGFLGVSSLAFRSQATKISTGEVVDGYGY